MSKKNKKVSTILHYMEHQFILAATVAGCATILTFASLVGIFVGIGIFSVELKFY